MSKEEEMPLFWDEDLRRALPTVWIVCSGCSRLIHSGLEMAAPIHYVAFCEECRTRKKGWQESFVLWLAYTCHGRADAVGALATDLRYSGSFPLYLGREQLRIYLEAMRFSLEGFAQAYDEWERYCHANRQAYGVTEAPVTPAHLRKETD